eukprot:235163_1
MNWANDEKDDSFTLGHKEWNSKDAQEDYEYLPNNRIDMDSDDDSTETEDADLDRNSDDIEMDGYQPVAHDNAAKQPGPQRTYETKPSAKQDDLSDSSSEDAFQESTYST